ncbi:hypothetical protein [Marinigracilibium pacificum]|uniref:Uncharacterized protein n=1 Tax=Marinigracilibium pacificum TaxID=2729599 RepID=A0A848IW59_9BACT|nr:hypothetical protein [Marinigracilibium pacificum]NMM47481.1 hypothetical protein [Marinigracilibium pacificum]
MKTEAPQWGITVGILLILLGSFGLISNYTMLNNNNSELSNSSFKSISVKMDSLNSRQVTNSSQKQNELLNHELENKKNSASNLSQFEQEKPSSLLIKWMRNFCLFGIIIGLINIIGGVMLLKQHHWTVRLVEVIIILNINYYIFQTIILLTDKTSGFFGRITAYNKFLAAFIFISLLAVLILYDKKNGKIRTSSHLDKQS